ncbi:MAG: hypothetical protein IJH43_02685 [Mogibacterium sp.]|nr:hypothetical protein [Mogibacterium sp.]
MPDTREDRELNKKEERLLARKAELDALEQEIRAREKELKAKDARRKQIILRLPESLWQDIAKWADDDFRSINSQIEYLLTKSVREHKKK